MRRRIALTAVWVTGLGTLLWWWDATVHFPALLLWTAGSIVLFLATAIAIHGRRFGDPPRLWPRVYLWTGVLIGAAIFHAIVPSLRVRDVVVQTSALLSVLDLVIAAWVFVSATALIWDPPARYVVLPAIVLLVAVASWLYMIPMPGSPRGPLPDQSATERDLSRRLRQHVTTLADTIGERNYLRYEALESAARYISESLAGSGYQVAFHEYAVGGRTYRNVEAELRGSGAADEVVVLGAHYDSVEGAPGADDNASGVAGLLELARLLRHEAFNRTVRFVAFPNEEPPHFLTEHMGSRVYAARAARLGERIVAMYALESIGYYADEPGSQQYPFPLSLFYPDVGDFIGFVGNLRSRSLVRRSIAAFRAAATIPSEGAAAPAWLPGINWSDQDSFWIHGYEAVMITDTAPFRNPYYHTPLDTSDRLDYGRMARVVLGIVAVLHDAARSPR